MGVKGSRNSLRRFFIKNKKREMRQSLQISDNNSIFNSTHKLKQKGKGGREIKNKTTSPIVRIQKRVIKGANRESTGHTRRPKGKKHTYAAHNERIGEKSRQRKNKTTNTGVDTSRNIYRILCLEKLAG